MAGGRLLGIYFENPFNLLYFFPGLPITLVKFSLFLNQQVVVAVGYFNGIKFAQEFLTAVMVLMENLGCFFEVFWIMKIFNMKGFSINVFTDH